jgi:hypothetical protein
MGCKDKKGGGKRKLAVLVGAVALAGCSAAKQNVQMLESPLVVGTLAVASQSQCRQFAIDRPKDADVTRRVLAGVIPQFQGCYDGLIAGLADPNAD